MEDDTVAIMLVQHYAAKFGVTFSSSLLDDNDPATKAKLLSLLQEAIAGKRGAVTDKDLV
jgi:hypothetical protein